MRLQSEIRDIKDCWWVFVGIAIGRGAALVTFLLSLIRLQLVRCTLRM